MCTSWPRAKTRPRVRPRQREGTSPTTPATRSQRRGRRAQGGWEPGELPYLTDAAGEVRRADGDHRRKAERRGPTVARAWSRGRHRHAPAGAALRGRAVEQVTAVPQARAGWGCPVSRRTSARRPRVVLAVRAALRAGRVDLADQADGSTLATSTAPDGTVSCARCCACRARRRRSAAAHPARGGRCRSPPRPPAPVAVPAGGGACAEAPRRRGLRRRCACGSGAVTLSAPTKTPARGCWSPSRRATSSGSASRPAGPPWRCPWRAARCTAAQHLPARRDHAARGRGRAADARAARTAARCLRPRARGPDHAGRRPRGGGAGRPRGFCVCEPMRRASSPGRWSDASGAR